MRAGAALCSTATPSCGGALEDLFKVDRVGVAAEELAAGGVGEDADVGVVEWRGGRGRSCSALGWSNWSGRWR